MSRVLIGSLIFILVFSGCLKNRNNPTGQEQVNDFPEFLAGTWKAQGNPWSIVLEPDGTVSSVVINMGATVVKPNEVTKVEMIDGQYSTFWPGPFKVQYDPQSRELYVDITIARLEVRIGSEGFQGNRQDVFAGIVSNDGQTWKTIWLELFDYGERLPMDLEAVGAELIFRKITDKKDR